jgi:hypothetical protein
VAGGTVKRTVISGRGRLVIGADRVVRTQFEALQSRVEDAPKIWCSRNEAPQGSNGNRQKTMTLAVDEFIRRFLLHVLPEGFQRIRYYGFLANRYRQQKLARCRQLLAVPPPAPPDDQAAGNYREQYQELTGSSLTECPACRRGRMVIIEVFKPPKPCRPIDDTS